MVNFDLDVKSLNFQEFFDSETFKQFKTLDTSVFVKMLMEGQEDLWMSAQIILELFLNLQEQAVGLLEIQKEATKKTEEYFAAVQEFEKEKSGGSLTEDKEREKVENLLQLKSDYLYTLITVDKITLKFIADVKELFRLIIIRTNGQDFYDSKYGRELSFIDVQQYLQQLKAEVQVPIENTTSVDQSPST